MTTNNTIGAHTNAVDAARTAGATMNDDGKMRYGKAGGNGNDAFVYRKGSGASALCFVFSMNAAYNGNALMSRAAIALDQMAYVESGLWPGNTRGGIEPGLASMLGRQYIEHANGAYRLTEGGLTRARLMLADCGIVWPDDETPAPAKPKKAKRKATKKAKPASEAVNGNDTAATVENGQVQLDDGANDQTQF